MGNVFFFFFSSRRRHTRFDCDWSSDVCSSDLVGFRYEVPQGEMQLLSSVELALHSADPADHTSHAPTQLLNLSGSSMSFEDGQHMIHVTGPVHAHQANFDLVCGKLDVELDEHNYAHRLIA